MTQNEIEQAMEYIEEHLAVELSLTDVARHCNYSPYYMSVSFHQHVGETMKSYIQKRRLTRAAELLAHTDQSIIQIALQYGYSSQEAFSRAFADRFGMTPHKYRQTRWPIQETYRKNISFVREQGSDNMEKSIQQLQETIEAKYPVNILHILNGSCMLERFESNELIRAHATYVSFNEAMCWGETDADIFSPAFIEARVAALHTTEQQYRTIVLEALRPLFEQAFDIVVLWFGDDMFCQLNLLTLVAYLEQIGYSGDVLFCMALERADDMLAETFELELGGYAAMYEEVLRNRQKPAPGKMMPVMYQAIQLYLTYREEGSPIIKYMKNNAGKPNLVADLLSRFPEYGLGDVQYQMMIDELREEERR